MPLLLEITDKVRLIIQQAVEKAQASGELPTVRMPSIEVEKPREKAHGDLATNIAMLLSREVKKPPREIAAVVTRHLDLSGTPVERVEVAGPGFINFFLRPTWLWEAVREIEEEGASFGRINTGHGLSVQVEFVSANPTGPLHVGHGRGAVLGSVLANVLAWAGYRVTREFYINDAGNQILLFGASLDARYRQALGEEVPIPAEGYHGEDLAELMRDLVAREGDRYLAMPQAERQAFLASYGLEKKLAAIKKDLADFGVEFDVWFSESELHRANAIGQVIDLLRERGMVYEKEGAIWLATSQFGDDKDRVLIRQNSLPTYFAADIAYHQNKFARGFERVINIWGADHHGYIPRMKAAVAALGYDPERLVVIITQMVTLLRGGQPVTMSKRAGQLVTLAEVVEEVGRDAARYFFLMRSPESQLDFDLDLARSQSEANPVYYIQYAHARICSLLRQAAAEGVISRVPPLESTLLQEGLLPPQDLERLTHPAERFLMEKLAALPEVVATAAARYEPHLLATYAYEVAAAYHSFYTECRCLGEEPPVTSARLILSDATRVVLANALRIMGLSAPERM